MLQKGEIFAGLKEIVLCLLTSWKEHIHSVAYLLKAAPVVETFKLEVKLELLINSVKSDRFGIFPSCMMGTGLFCLY